MNALQVKQLKISLGGTELLHGIDFSVEKGENVAIVGPNGAGKSTLVKCLARVLDAWTGEVSLLGRSVRKYSRRELARLVGFVPQRNGAFPSYSVEEFLRMSRYAWHGLADTQESLSIQGALERTGTVALRKRAMDTLSGGESQKVLIAAALAQDAEIILLDEPATFLDPRFQHEVHSIVQGFSASGITVLSVTHDLNAASQADRILALKSGTLQHDLPPKDFFQQGVLEDLFETHFTMASHPETGLPVVI